MANVAPETATRVITRLLAPVVRLAINIGVPFQAFAELIKIAYVREVERSHSHAKRLTDSQIFVRTGVHRKEVRRIRSANAPADAATLPLTTRVALEWSSNDRFADAQGRPLALARRSPAAESAGDSGGVTFDELVTRVTSDVNPAAVLDDMVQQNMVSARPDGMLALSREWSLHTSELDGVLLRGSEVMYSRLAVGVSNFLAREHKHFAVTVYTEKLDASVVTNVRALLENEGVALAERVNQAFAAGEVREADTAGMQRVTFGLFLYDEANDPETSIEQTEIDVRTTASKLG
jgi:Family of unknown function (DUF6502)